MLSWHPPPLSAPYAFLGSAMKKRSALEESPFRGDARVETANVDISFHHANPTHHSKDQPSSKSHWKKKKESSIN